MARFALVCLLAAIASTDALRIPDSLKSAAQRETVRNPSLRKKDAERKNVLQHKLASMAVTDEQAKRHLANNYQNANQYQNADGNANQYQNADAYYWDQYMDQNGIGFDITNYAVKYTQCATVQTYSDELAENEYSDTVLAAKRFALFRLCPKDSCSSYSQNGCGRDYGEYLVSLDQFLVSMLEYQESRVIGYCEYCQNCAAIESAKMFWKQAYNEREYALEQAKDSYSNWYTSYLESYYNNNNGYNNANNQQNGDNADGNYQQMDSNIAAQRYYQAVRSGGNYANNYAQNNYQQNNANGQNQNVNYGYQAVQQYQWTNPQMWEFQSNQNRMYNNQNAWQSMGNPAGSFYGRTILNGYYDGNGDFIQEYGYFNSYGAWVSLEDDELEWDEGLWGEMPEGWEDVTLDTESCSYQYAGSCYNQYDACMQILQDQDYQMYQDYQSQNQEYQYGSYNYQQNQQQYAQQNEMRATLKDFVGCVEVQPQWNGGQYGNYAAAANYQNAQQMQYNCYDGDENCENYRKYQQNKWEYNQQMYGERRYFIGPHCGSNGRDISLAVYKDEYCSVLDEDMDASEVLGYNPNGEGIDLFPDECMSCLMEEQQEAWYEDEEVYAIEPMCSMLYQFAGKCNTNLKAEEYNAANDYDYYQYQKNNYKNYQNNQNQNNQNQNQNQQEGGSQDQNGEQNAYKEYYQNLNEDYTWKQMYQSQQQAKNEEAVCSFIDSLSANTYDENGQITIFGGDWANPSAWNAEFIAETRAMSPGIKAALVLTAIAAVSMAVAACVLHGTLARKNIPWKPRRSKGQDPTDLARQNSGITMGRSRSGPGGANPLL